MPWADSDSARSVPVGRHIISRGVEAGIFASKFRNREKQNLGDVIPTSH